MRATWRPLHKMMAMQFLKESENMLAFVNLVNRAYDKRMARGSTVLIRTPERCR